MALQQVSNTKKKLFDGLDVDFYKFNFNIDIPQKITIYERDFRKNYFDNLENIMKEEDFKKLISEGLFIAPIGPFDSYKGIDKLSLNYFIINDYLFIFSNGEFQPSRYKIYLEGIWIFENKSK